MMVVLEGQGMREALLQQGKRQAVGWVEGGQSACEAVQESQVACCQAELHTHLLRQSPQFHSLFTLALGCLVGQ